MDDSRPPSLRTAWVAGLSLVGAYGWWAAGLRPFTARALAVTLATGLAVILAGILLRRRRGTTGAPNPNQGDAAFRRGLAIWGVLLMGLTLWELAAFVQLPRSEHPTVSSLANSVFDSRLVRAVAFGAWVGAGFEIARR